MSKKIIITVSIILLLFLLSLIGYYFITKSNNPAGGGITSGFRSFFPFGGNDLPPPENSTTTEPTPTQPEDTTPNFTQKLRKISAEPVAGAGTFDVKAGTLVRYIERATGHIFEVELFSPRQVRISNTTIPLVYNAVWGSSQDYLITQYLKDNDQKIDTYSLTIKNLSTTTENTITGVPVSTNIAGVSSFGKEAFYITEDINSSSGFVTDFGGTKLRQIWRSNIKQLIPQFVNSNTVMLTTKPATNIPGFLYSIDTKTGSSKRILDGLGLSTNSDSLGEQIFVLENGSLASSFIYNQKAKTKTKVTPDTFPEKCVWSKKDKNTIFCAVPKDSINANSLILWYQGQISSNDDIWKYDIKNNKASIIENLSQDSGEVIDVMKPTLSENEQYLVFINKIDNSLWSLDLLQ